jgi:hypothetical protein
MDTSDLNFYTVMLAINKGEMPVDDICNLHQYPGPGTDDYILLHNTYVILKKKEAAGKLIREEPSIKNPDGSFTLDDYIRQKVWWYSGPEKYYMMEEDLRYMSLLLTDGDNKIKDTIANYENNISELKQGMANIEQAYKNRLEMLKSEAKSALYGSVIAFAVVTISPFVYLFCRSVICR